MPIENIAVHITKSNIFSQLATKAKRQMAMRLDAVVWEILRGPISDFFLQMLWQSLNRSQRNTQSNFGGLGLMVMFGVGACGMDSGRISKVLGSG